MRTLALLDLNVFACADPDGEARCFRFLPSTPLILPPPGCQTQLIAQPATIHSPTPRQPAHIAMPIGFPVPAAVQLTPQAITVVWLMPQLDRQFLKHEPKASSSSGTAHPQPFEADLMIRLFMSGETLSLR